MHMIIISYTCILYNIYVSVLQYNIHILYNIIYMFIISYIHVYITYTCLLCAIMYMLITTFGVCSLCVIATFFVSLHLFITATLNLYFYYFYSQCVFNDFYGIQ